MSNFAAAKLKISDATAKRQIENNASLAQLARARDL